ncbi:putative pyrophosphatase/phosphodiesterase [Smittium mucronatum]|uniref:Putative pyrophosphatase/phosphodiesterase n=1 Tax=Smittium mucronatum TaxID=133383 RepID=A0A1R0GXW4_9FUNG|nr:putative pyrophosphatase/phosphodiesterase [Smittium mucronatum]
MISITSSMLFLAFVAASPITARDDNTPLNAKANTVILISIDGFAQDYFSYGITPNIANLGKSGVFADYMKPVFPTLTYPNHQSIATGLYPENHGLISNTFYSERLNDTFNYLRPDSFTDKWWGGEPFWITAEKNNLTAVVDQFPGGLVEIEGIRPSYYSPYDLSVSQTTKMDKLINWLELPAAQRPTLLVSYFAEVDVAGHSFSPGTKGLKDAVIQADTSIGYLVNQLKSKNLYDKVNIIIVSDHGMEGSMIPKDYIYINDLLAKANLELSKNSKKAKCSALKPVKEKILAVHMSPNAGIYPVYDKDIMPLYKKLKMVEDQTKFNVYLKKDIPKRYIYKYNDRIPPVVVVAKEPYMMRFNSTLYNSPDLSKRSSDLEKRQSTTDVPNGAHGFDNEYQNMRAIFVAHGPAFKSPKTPTASTNFPPISAIDVYNVVTKLLKVPAARNDGNATIATNMLI